MKNITTTAITITTVLFNILTTIVILTPFHWVWMPLGKIKCKIQIVKPLHHLRASEKKPSILSIRQGKYLGLLDVSQVSGYITCVYQTAVCFNLMDQFVLYFFVN